MLILGVSVDRGWVTDPVAVKKEFYDLYSSRFKTLYNIPMASRSNLFFSLNPEDVQLLESPFSGEEIKDSVWDYGGDRAPSPDGVSYKFLKHYCV